MAEFLLKVGDTERYPDGDIVCAFNRRHIRSLHAQRLCDPWRAVVNDDGLLPLGTHIEEFYRHTHQFRSERVGDTLRRTNQWTDQTLTLSGDPIEDPERPGHLIYVNVAEFFARRKARRAPNGAPKLAMFGQSGSEIIYHGRKDVSNAKLDLVWAAIEAKTPYREADYPRMPLSREQEAETVVLSVSEDTRKRLRKLGRPEPFQVKYFGANRQYGVAPEGTQVDLIRGGADARHLFAISVDDFDDVTAQMLVGPLRYTEPVVITNVDILKLAAVQEEQTAYRLTVDRDLQHIRWPETIEIDGTMFAIAPEGPKVYVVQTKEVLPSGSANITGIVTKRKHHVVWQDLPGLSAETRANVADRTKYVDIRAAVTFSRAGIIEEKTVA